jgi:hypothetical protein
VNVERTAAIGVATAAVLAGALGPLAAAALSAKSATAVVYGPIGKVEGSAFRLSTSITQTGTSTVKLASSTEVSEQLEASAKNLTKGVCVSAFGSADSKGKVTATSLTISSPSKGKCSGGFGGRAGNGPPSRPGALPQPGSGSGAPAPGGSSPGSLGLAMGKVSSVDGQTLRVRETVGGKTDERLVTITKDTSLRRIASVGAEAIKTNLCAFVLGTSSDAGVTVNAQTIRLSHPSSGGCSASPPRR